MALQPNEWHITLAVGYFDSWPEDWHCASLRALFVTWRRAVALERRLNRHGALLWEGLQVNRITNIQLDFPPRRFSYCLGVAACHMVIITTVRDGAEVILSGLGLRLRARREIHISWR